MKTNLLHLLKDQNFPDMPQVLTADLSGQTVVVTGANTGLGFETAKHFSRMNPGKLILACRCKKKGKKAVEDIIQWSACDNVELRLVDLADFTSVKTFVKTFEENDDRLDIFVENAGIFLPKGMPQFTRDGWEREVQVNNLSNALVALLLLPRMIRTASQYATQPRLVIVSSFTHYWAELDQSLLQSTSTNFFRKYAHEDEMQGLIYEERYNETKRTSDHIDDLRERIQQLPSNGILVLNVFFARALANRIDAGQVIVNTVHPGYCTSELRRDMKGFSALKFNAVEFCIGRTTEKGARQIIWAAIAEDNNPDSLHGAYISHSAVAEPSDWVLGEEGRGMEEKLWKDLISELIRIEPYVKKVVNTYLKLDGRLA